MWEEERKSFLSEKALLVSSFVAELSQFETMDTQGYLRLLEQPVGFTPGIVVSSEQVAALHLATAREPSRRMFIPFGGLILPFHEAVLSTPEAVHDFVVSHFTRKLRELTLARALYVRACPITGAAVLQLLSRKGLIVDLAARRRIHDVVLSFRDPLQFSTKQHILHKLWYFYSLLPNSRSLLSGYFGTGDQPSSRATEPGSIRRQSFE